ncbi:MAG: hypothetical protein ACFFCD_03695 [Promethearchaeota archaeon]
MAQIREDRTGSVTLAGILELISALDTLFVGLLGIFYLQGILIVGLFSDYAIVLTALSYFAIATTSMATIGPLSMTTVMGIVAIIWGVLGLIATAGILKVTRWGLWLASIFNIVLIIDMILLLNNPLTQGMIATTSFALLFYLFLIVFPIVVEIILLLRRADFV